MKTLLLAILASILFPVCAGAAQLEVGIGLAQANTRGDGTWYQQRFPHSLGLRSPALMIGATGNVLPGLSWHADGVYLGRYTVDSLDTPNDANYSAASPTGCNGACLPLAHYHGSGEAYGLAATLEAHTRGAWQLGIEAGPLVYERSWSISVPDWYPSVETSPGVFQAGATSPINTIDRGVSLGYVVGLSVEHSGLGLRLRYYDDGAGFPRGGDAWPPIWRGQFVLMGTDQF